MEDREMIESLLAAQVLTLARLLKAEAASKGTWSTSDYVPDAVRLIQQKRPQILSMLR